MGDRGAVRIAGVHLYTHAGATSLPETVRAALDRGRDRWTVPEHLARILFSEMVREDLDGLTGYAIAAGPFDVWRVVEVTAAGEDLAHPSGRVRVLDATAPIAGDPLITGRTVIDRDLAAYVEAGIHLERCPRCGAWVDLVAHAHVYEDGARAGFRCDACGIDYLYGADGRPYTQGPDGIAEEIRPDGTTINHETAAQARTAALRGDLP